MRVYRARRRALKALQPDIFCKMLRELMTETLFALGADQTLTDGMGTNVAEIVPSGLNRDRPKSDPCSKEALETTRLTSKIEAPRRGRGRPAGPSLRILLTQKFPDGATAEMLIGAGFRGDLPAALERKDVQEQHGRYVWHAVSRPDPTHVREPQGSPNPPALLPLVPVLDLEHLNKEELRTERFRLKRYRSTRLRSGSGGALWTRRRSTRVPTRWTELASRHRLRSIKPIMAILNYLLVFTGWQRRNRLTGPKSSAASFRWTICHVSSGKSMKTCAGRNSMNWSAASIWPPGKQSTSSCTQRPKCQ